MGVLRDKIKNPFLRGFLRKEGLLNGGLDLAKVVAETKRNKVNVTGLVFS